ncbi:MAG: DNA-directed RNA polymerase subunit P [Thermoplasmatota archaeon]
MYKCGRCGEKLITEFSPIGIQCSKCGYKIFYKERPNRKKVLKAQ